jgi:hypothetical protein
VAANYFSTELHSKAIATFEKPKNICVIISGRLSIFILELKISVMPTVLPFRTAGPGTRRAWFFPEAEASGHG